MRLDTRVGLTVLVIGAVAAGVWVGLLMTRDEAPGRDRRPPVRSRNLAAHGSRIMAAPPARAPVKVRPAAEREKPAERKRLLPIAIAAPKPAPAAGTVPPAGTAQPKQGPSGRDAPGILSAKQLIAGGKKYEARGLLTRQILAAREGPKREELRALLEKINAELFFSSAPSPDSTFYIVRSGDAVSRIATKTCKRDAYFADLIGRVNGIRNVNKIRAGQRLKIPVGTFSALVQRRAHRLTIFLNGHYIREYPVAVGASASPTPVAKFVVANTKTKEPPWTTLDGQVYKYGDPKNILGTRWIGFEETDQHQGFGIHGSADPKTIGKSVSNGCVRMLNKDVEEIFGMLMPGDSVRVVE